MAAQSEIGADILPDRGGACHGVSEYALHLPYGRARCGPSRNGLPGRGLALEIPNRASDDCRHGPNGRPCNSPATEN